MSDILTQALRNERRQDLPWVTLFAVRNDQGEWFRIAAFDQPVYFGTASDGSRVEWLPYSFEFGDLVRDSDGSVNGYRVAVSNADPKVMEELDAHDFTGQPAQLFVVNLAQLDTPGGVALEDEGEVELITVQDQTASVQVAAGPRMLDEFCPSRPINRKRCPYPVYGGDECLVDLSLPGMPQACPRSLEACEARGDVEVANGLPRVHPLFFGAQPGAQS